MKKTALIGILFILAIILTACDNSQDRAISKWLSEQKNTSTATPQSYTQSSTQVLEAFSAYLAANAESFQSPFPGTYEWAELSTVVYAPPNWSAAWQLTLCSREDDGSVLADHLYLNDESGEIMTGTSDEFLSTMVRVESELYGPERNRQVTTLTAQEARRLSDILQMREWVSVEAPAMGLEPETIIYCRDGSYVKVDAWKKATLVTLKDPANPDLIRCYLAPEAVLADYSEFISSLTTLTTK